MLHLLHRTRLIVLTITAIALSASLAFAGQPPSAASGGLSNAALHAGKIVPVAAGHAASTDPEDAEEAVDEEAGEAESAEAAGESCAADPTTLTAEELAALKHGSIACWAAHQAEWPEWFKNHGAFVRCWAHQGKADAASCTEEPAVDAATSGRGNKSKTKDHGKP